MGQPLVPNLGYRQDNINLFNVKRTQGDFPDFDYFPSTKPTKPTKPYKPLFLDNEFAITSYNASVRDYNRRVRDYNRRVADFTATVKAYIEDAEHYIENCKNDYREIRQKGLKLLTYIESLNIDVEVDLRGI